MGLWEPEPGLEEDLPAHSGRDWEKMIFQIPSNLYHFDSWFYDFYDSMNLWWHYHLCIFPKKASGFNSCILKVGMTRKKFTHSNFSKRLATSKTKFQVSKSNEKSLCQNWGQHEIFLHTVNMHLSFKQLYYCFALLLKWGDVSVEGTLLLASSFTSLEHFK